ncbi:MAG: NAD(P)-dependent oxidoreductase [Bdellovibrionales bacterium CG10_big_fil_rev_8_21_14_0_10_45_34]|nr:MAG: NAD(P)-dependent oxidoreductase [Bdellovibrionales bacterium CG10_big_fil_rev_8_21_14_0_10_45_34]
MKNTTAIVTGASSGIGIAISKHLCSLGYNVIGIARSEAKLESVKKELGPCFMPVACDVSMSDCVPTLSKAFEAYQSKISVIVNNAGIIKRSTFVDSSEAQWTREFETNLFGSFRVVRAALPFLAKPSSIINIASTLGIRPIAETSVYSASKAAMLNWTKSIAIEFAPNIRVNAISPGIIETPIHQGRDLTQDGHLQPMNRVGMPSDLLPAVDYLINAQWVTGTNVVVDGGILL